jgi:hypothetical protein
LMNTSTITTVVVTCWHLSTSPSMVVLLTNMSSSWMAWLCYSSILTLIQGQPISMCSRLSTRGQPGRIVLDENTVGEAEFSSWMHWTFITLF